MASNNETQSTPASSGVNKRRRFRKPISCQPCRHSKLRCDRQSPCASCRRRNCAAGCKYVDDEIVPAFNAVEPEPLPQPHSLGLPMQSSESSHRVGYVSSRASSPLVVSASYNAASQQPQDREDPIAACSDFAHSHWESVLQRPIEQISHSLFEAQDPFCQLDNLCFPFPFGPKVSTNELITALPSLESCEYLITQYFARISPFFHVLHGPTFQRQFRSFAKNPSSCDLSWLALLFLICSITVNAVDDEDPVLNDITSNMCSGDSSATISSRYRVMAMICLCKDNFLIRHRMSTLESLLILVYTISHNEGLERGWVLLGMATNIGVALQCNTPCPPSNLNHIDIERRRRCWAGILMLHTYQAILFRDVDMSSLMNDEAAMPADVNDTDIFEDEVLPPSTHPTQMSIIKFKISLFRLSARICKQLSDEPQLNEACLEALDTEISSEQRQWASAFLVDGAPSVLDSSSYALWCGLELYAHQLYLLLHRPFSQAANPRRYRPQSRQKCIVSSEALLEIHRKWVELPRLRNYRWYAHGIIGSCALHAMVTLASCLLEQADGESDMSSHRIVFNAGVVRLSKLKERNPLYLKAYPVLQHLQTLLSPDQFAWSSEASKEFGNDFDNWIDNVQWLNPESIDWKFWDELLNSSTAEGLS